MIRRLKVHATLRWTGVALFLVALPGVGMMIIRVATGQSPPLHLLTCVLALGVSLGAFGTNNDTAVHAMRELWHDRLLPAAFADELARERSLRATALAEVHASEKAGFVFPLLATLAVAWLYHRVGVPG